MRKSPRARVMKSGIIEEAFGPEISCSVVIPGIVHRQKRTHPTSIGRGQTCEHQQSRQTPILSKHNIRAQSIANHNRRLGVKVHSTGPLNISSELNIIESTHLAFIQSSIVVDGFPVHMGSLTANLRGALTAPPPGNRPPGTGYVLSSFVTMK